MKNEDTQESQESQEAMEFGEMFRRHTQECNRAHNIIPEEIVGDLLTDKFCTEDEYGYGYGLSEVSDTEMYKYVLHVVHMDCHSYIKLLERCGFRIIQVSDEETVLQRIDH